MISVIGGAGFIGTRFCQLLADQSIPFEILDIKASKRFAGVSKQADIREITDLRDSISGDSIVHLAAVHRDDVRPLSLYHDVNVEGTRQVCVAAEEKGINRIVFVSSVAVYGFADPDTDESGQINPFNEYGRTKFEAEKILHSWREKDPENRGLTIVRPTVVFGEGNRGNVYNLLRQIQSGLFIMIGGGRNRKSMAYVGNVSSFLVRTLELEAGARIYNYVDKPDLDMNELVTLVRGSVRGKQGVGLRLPIWSGRLIGLCADVVSRLSGKNLPVSSIRVKKFTETTSFQSAAHTVDGFSAPFTLAEGLQRTLKSEFICPDPDAEVFVTE